MKVTVVYVTPKIRFIKELEVAKNSTVQTVVEQSGVLQKHPEISLDKNKVGIFSEIIPLDTIAKENDRVEIYRVLTMDPMEARRLRARART